MKTILYVPYSNGDCVNGFKYDGSITEKQYSALIVNEYNKYRDTIDEVVSSRYAKNMAINPFMKQDNHYKQQSYSYNDCNCEVMNMRGQDATINEIISLSRTGDECILILNITNMVKTPDLETDIRMWIRESNHIMNSGRLSDEEKIYNLPKKDFKMTFIDNKNTALLKDCKLVEVYNRNSFAVLIKKISFIK